MAVNLDTLNISLNSFDAASDGDFNIGHIKLNEDGTGVCRTNRHKTFEFLNWDTISPEETLAIKNAFYDALSRERLSSESMDDIRTRLGLKKDTVGALSPRDMRPLTAAQVREILDQYADEINANRDARNNLARVRTSHDIHPNFSAQELKNRRTVCDATNARSEAKMTLRASADLKRAMDMFNLIGTEPSLVEQSPQTEQLAGDLLANLMPSNALNLPGKTLMLTAVPLTLVRGNQGTLLAQVRVDDENVFTLDTGRTKTELIRWAQKVLGLSAPLAAPVTNVVPVRHSLSPRERRKLLPDLQDAFTIVNDAALMEPLVQAKLPTIPDKLNGRTYTEEIRRQHAEYKVREDLTEGCVKPLVIALNEVRPKDARNAELVNKVRAIIGGAEFIGTDASGKRMLNTPQNRKQILDEITKLISQDRVDPSVVAVQDIKPEGIDDDEIEGNLNIDEIEGNV